MTASAASRRQVYFQDPPVNEVVFSIRFEPLPLPLTVYGELAAEDEVWQRLIRDYLSKHYPEQAAEVEKQIPALRFRPVEVATAASSNDTPLSFQTIQTRIPHFVDLIRSI